MRTLLLTTVAAGLLLTATATAEIRLRQQASPSGDTVTLGDLFDGLDARANVVIGPAPAPGSRATFQIKHIVALARQHELAWRPRGDEKPLVVTRDGNSFTRRDVLDRIRGELRARGIDGDLDIDLAGRLVDANFKRSATEMMLRDFQFDGATGQFNGEIVIYASAGPREFLPLSGRALSIRRVPVVQRLIRRGQAIAADDVVWTEIKLAPAVRGIADDRSEVVGKAARRTLRPGKPLQQADLTEPVIVEKGSLVTVSLSAPGLRLTTMGRALEDAALGEAVKVMNAQSKRTIETTVIGPGQVRVRLRKQFAVAANQ